MSYFRRGMGDGPITDPCQVDPSACTTVGTVTPTVVDCAQLPADSPFRQAGQPCAPGGSGKGAPTGGPMDWLVNTIQSSVAAGSPSAPDTSDTTKLLLVGALVAAYYAFWRKKR